MRVFKYIFRGFVSCLEGPKPHLNLVLALTGVLVGWWLYVPLHELLHALGCRMGGGEVSRLDIQPLYGGTLLAKVFHFVVADGGYAGRLSGFDTGGSDWVYALTVALPFVLTLPGFWMIEKALRKQRPFLFGAALPLALSPLLSLTGDYLELGSLLLFHLWPGPQGVHRSLISDDLFRLLGELAMPPGLIQMAFVAMSQLLGLIMAWGTIALAGRAALGRT